MMFDDMKMKKKLVIGFTMLQILVFSSTILFVAYNVDKRISQKVFENSKELVGKHAKEFQNKLADYMRSAQTMAEVLSKKDGIPISNRREYVESITKNLLESNSDFFGTWSIWESNEFDGDDQMHSNIDGYAESGKFQTYFYRDGAEIGVIRQFDYLTDTASFYRIPKELGKAVILEPYYDPDAKLTMTSLTAPIIIDGKVRGVFGIDITLDGLQKMIESIKPYNNSYSLLVSNEGTIAAHPKKEMINKKVGSEVNDLLRDSMKKTIKIGKAFSISKISPLNGKMTELFFEPFQVGDYVSPWAVGISVPFEEILSETNELYYLIALVAVVGILISIFVGGFFAIRMSKPIEQMAEVASKISKGDFNVSINIKTKDESGILADNFRTMIDVIKNLTSEVDKLTTEAAAGHLDFRADSKSFSGAYYKLVDGINNTLDQIIKPLNVTAEYVDRISKGDIPPKITEEYRGDFNEIKNNLNLCIDSINLLIVDTKSLINSASLGRLNDRAETSRHLGEFKNIISGINQAYDRIVGLIDNMPLPVQIVNTEYKIIYANKETLKNNI